MAHLTAGIACGCWRISRVDRAGWAVDVAHGKTRGWTTSRWARDEGIHFREPTVRRANEKQRNKSWCGAWLRLAGEAPLTAATF